MQTIYSPKQAAHAGNLELAEGALVPAFESPQRAEMIRARVQEVALGPIHPPADQDLTVAARVHTPEYLAYLQDAWSMWVDAGREGSAMPFVWPPRDAAPSPPPRHIDGLLGYHSFDAGAAFVAGTWDAVKASHDCALTAADLVASGEAAAFALCRPPGHHAGQRTAGGYCFINNAAVAAERLCNSGERRVSILDIDYHHGNGTQEIFYERADVQVINIHADPLHEYPYFSGHGDERGRDAGAGFNLNLPLPLGADFAQWSAALEIACGALATFAPEVLVVSLGVDTYKNDPISAFALEYEDFPLVGRRLRALNLPTLFIMEGGYAVDMVGVNVVGVLTGFEAG